MKNKFIVQEALISIRQHEKEDFKAELKNAKYLEERLVKIPSSVSLHLKNIYKEQELDENSTTEKSSVVRQESNRKVKRTIKHSKLPLWFTVSKIDIKKGIK